MKNNLTLIFDFDGTIAETLPFFIDVFNKSALKSGFKKIEAEEIEKLRGKEAKEIIKFFKIPLIKIPSLLKNIRSILAQEIENLKPAEGIKKVLLQLKKKGFAMGILTSNSEENVRKFLRKNNLDLFDFIYSDSSIWRKDKMIKLLAKKRKLNLTDVVYLGDETRDIASAKKAGVRIIAVSWGFNNADILKKYQPDFLIEKPDDLINVLNRIQA